MTEGLALTGAWVDKEQGLISLVALEMGSSSRLCAEWRPGEEIIVMGATGTPTEIPSGKTVLLAGGGLGNAVLFSIGKAMRAAGNRVIYFAGYRDAKGLFKAEEVEEASDVVVWAVDPAPGAKRSSCVAAARPQLHRQHSRRDGGLREGRARAADDSARRSRPSHRDRIRPHDGRGKGSPPRAPEAVPEGWAHGDWLHQLAHAMHDERHLCAVPL